MMHFVQDKYFRERAAPTSTDQETHIDHQTGGKAQRGTPKIREGLRGVAQTNVHAAQSLFFCAQIGVQVLKII